MLYRKFNPIFTRHTGDRIKQCGGTNKLFQSHSVPILPLLSPSFPPPTFINNGGISDRALFCHLTFPPLHQQQAEMLREQITAGLQYTWSKNQHGYQCAPEFSYSAKPVLWRESPLLFTGPFAYHHLRALWPTHKHTHTGGIFLYFLIASMHCAGVWGTIHLSQRTHPHRHAQADVYSHAHEHTLKSCCAKS